MSVPPADNKKWREIVQGDLEFDVEFFPLKLLLARQRLQMQISPGPDTLEKCVEELRQMFLKNQKHPIARKDLKKIFGRRGFLRRLFGR